jgi:magnesium chelatase subunit I
MDGFVAEPREGQVAEPREGRLSAKPRRKRAQAALAAKPAFPFSAIVAQEELKLSLLLCAVDGSIGGVLALGDRGTGKSTAIRALAALLPPMPAIAGCRFNCEPARAAENCETCRAARTQRILAPVPVVDLPLGATEDRLVGALDLERALTEGRKSFEPGLLARAHRGFLYIDEVNLLEDHLVDLLLDVAASGENVVERDGLSIRHPARFVLVGSGNPEEGELRPQLLDRFGLSVEVTTPTDLATRVEVIKRRDSYERDPEAFAAHWSGEEAATRDRILVARGAIHDVRVPDGMLELAARLCIAAGTDGLRGELTLLRAARALAALEATAELAPDHLRRLAAMSLRHRLRRNPLDDALSSTRVARAVDEVFTG